MVSKSTVHTVHVVELCTTITKSQLNYYFVSSSQSQRNTYTWPNFENSTTVLVLSSDLSNVFSCTAQLHRDLSWSKYDWNDEPKLQSQGKHEIQMLGLHWGGTLSSWPLTTCFRTQIETEPFTTTFKFIHWHIEPLYDLLLVNLPYLPYRHRPLFLFYISNFNRSL